MMNLSALKIDPEFQGKIPPLNAEEEHILEQNMIQERRLLNPLIIWNGYILDGHSRYRTLQVYSSWLSIASSSITRKSLLK